MTDKEKRIEQEIRRGKGERSRSTTRIIKRGQWNSKDSWRSFFAILQEDELVDKLIKEEKGVLGTIFLQIDKLIREDIKSESRAQLNFSVFLKKIFSYLEYAIFKKMNLEKCQLLIGILEKMILDSPDL